MNADQPAPTVLDPPLGAAVKDRFCQAERWQHAFENESAGFVACGGELRHARRVEGELIVTYLRCVFCGHLTRMLEYDMGTGEDRAVEDNG